MYTGIPNSNKKVILVRNGSASNNDSMPDDASANWRSLFKDILCATASKSGAVSTILGTSLGENVNLETAAEDTKVNSNISLLMTQQIEKISTSNNFTPVVTSMNKGFDEFQNSLRNHGISSSINGLFSAIAGASSIIYEATSQFRNNIKGTDESNDATTASNRNLLPWFTNVKAWDKESASVNFDYTFNFAMGQYGLWNAREEVFLPILNLVAPTLIRHLDTFTTTGPYPSATGLIMKAFDGKTEEEKESAELNPELYKNGMSAIETLIMNSYKGFSYSISFGSFMKFNKVIIENSDYSFSHETDQYGYPISGSVTLHFSSIVPVSLSSNDANTMALRLGV